MAKKFKYYTKEQEERIEMLRQQAEADRIDHQKEVANIRRWNDEKEKNKVTVGMHVTVCYDSNKIPGYVIEMDKKGNFKVNTPAGIIKSRLGVFIYPRKKPDYSKVIVPDEIRNKSLKDLLYMLKQSRIGDQWWGYETRTESDYQMEEYLRAELSRRPNIRKKGKNRIFKRMASK